MKEICTCKCCAAPYSPLVTPWCELLKDKDDSCSVLHLWYNIEMVRKEVEKRTSILGKLRRTEEAQHLLDLIALTVDEKEMFIPFAKAAMADVYEILHNHMPKREKAYWWREGQETATFDEETTETVQFYAGQYVMYNGKLYMAIEDGNSDDTDLALKLVTTEDYRESMHYGILWNCNSNVNAIEPLDVAIFEALVARIIYKWLQYAYPDEAPRYLQEFAECAQAIRNRVSTLDNVRIVSRIPRIF